MKEVRMAEVKKIIDGDTIEVLIDLGLGVFITKRIRFNGVNAKEINKEEKAEGFKAKKYLEGRILGQQIELCILGQDSFSRILGEVYIKGQNLNDELFKLGLVELSYYKK